MRAWTRRRFLQIAAASGVAASVPWLDGCADDDSTHSNALPTPTPLPAPAHFFTAEERLVSERFASALMPEGGGVAGAATTDAVEYIDRYLAAFDNATPAIFRAGPFSGRWPFPDPDTGAPGEVFPRNDFADALPLTRMQELAFRVELEGSAAVPNGDINAPLVPTLPGLRALYRGALAGLPLSSDEILQLDDAAVLELLGQTPSNFQAAFVRHVGEGMFGAPEYGGNAGGRGWNDYDYDGDSQPLGHTLFDAAGVPRDRPDQPNQTEDPARPARAFAPEVEEFLTAITRVQGGTKFF
jgi:hypothetical protein